MEKTGPKVIDAASAVRRPPPPGPLSNASLVRSARRLLRRDGSPWTRGGSCTSKIRWWVLGGGGSGGLLLTALCQDAYARGEVFVGSKDDGYSVLPGLPSGVQSSRRQFGITVATPHRIFLLACESERERTDWLATFRMALDRPMLPPEYAGTLFRLRPSARRGELYSLSPFSLSQWRPVLSTNLDPLKKPYSRMRRPPSLEDACVQGAT